MQYLTGSFRDIRQHEIHLSSIVYSLLSKGSLQVKCQSRAATRYELGRDGNSRRRRNTELTCRCTSSKQKKRRAHQPSPSRRPAQQRRVHPARLSEHLLYSTQDVTVIRSARNGARHTVIDKSSTTSANQRERYTQDICTATETQ